MKKLALALLLVSNFASAQLVFDNSVDLGNDTIEEVIERLSKRPACSPHISDSSPGNIKVLIPKSCYPELPTLIAGNVIFTQNGVARIFTLRFASQTPTKDFTDMRSAFRQKYKKPDTDKPDLFYWESKNKNLVFGAYPSGTLIVVQYAWKGPFRSPERKPDESKIETYKKLF